MKLVRIEFKNIGAYGNKLQTIEFSNDGKLILLQGKSGDGKSTLLNLPTLLFYGKITKRSKKEICNRVNKNGYIKGTIISKNHEYVIERKFSPNGVKVYKDGEDLDTIGVKDSQAYIDENIVQMPFEIFTNIVSLSMNKFKSFLNMSTEDRRQIIDRVFNLEKINDIYALVKKDLRDNGYAINSDNSQIFTLTQTINQANQELVKLNEQNNSENSEKIEQCNNIIKEETEKITAYNAKLQEFSQAYAADNKQFQEIYGNIQKINMAASMLQKKLNLYNGGNCPTCGASFESEEFQTLKKELSEKIQKSQEFIQTEYANQKTIQDHMTQINTGIQTLNNAIRTSQTLINNARNSIYALNEAMKQNAEYKSIQNIIESNTDSLNKAKEQLEKDTEQMKYLSLLAEIYSVDGIKKQILKEYIPHLNHEINKSLSYMDFPYRLQFNDSFESTLYYLNEEIGADTLSDGEHKRVDLAVLCSVFKLLKRKYPTINIFTLDEVLSSLDSITASTMLRYLKEFADEMQLNIFVVSHIDMEEALFDEAMRVYKEMGFSDIEFFKK